MKIKTKKSKVKTKSSNIASDITYSIKDMYMKGKKYTEKSAETNVGAYEDADENFKDMVENTSASASSFAKRKMKQSLHLHLLETPSQKSSELKMKNKFVHIKLKNKIADVVTVKDKVASVFKCGSAIINTAKIAITNTRILFAALLGTGGFAALFTIIICMIGLVMGSSFGIFMATEDTGTGYTLTNVIQTINEEYYAESENIKANTQYDDLVVTADRPLWRDILAVYAVKMTAGSEGADVVTINEQKEDTIRKVFWDMTQITADTETYEETCKLKVIDESGEVIEQETIVEKTRLIISTQNKTAADMAAVYEFNVSQNLQLEELLSEENIGLWSFLDNMYL